MVKKLKQLLLQVFDFRGLSFLHSKRITGNMVLMFFLIIFFPIVFKTARCSDDGNRKYIDEHRVPIVKPEFDLNSIFPYFEKYEKYYNDNFIFRGFIISKFNKLKYGLFNSSPVSSVFIGKERWLFLARENGINLSRYYFSYYPFKKSLLEKYKGWIVRRKKWAESLGCCYLLVVVPNKQTIYPEMMPPGLDKVAEETLTDSLVRFLKAEVGDIFIDLRKSLLRRKEKQRIYQRSDTHWNHLGAFTGYREILRTLSKVSGEKMRPENLSRFRIVTRGGDGGDLARILTLQRNVYKDRIITLERIVGDNRNVDEEFLHFDYKGLEIEKKINRSGKFSSMLFLHDSFGEYLKRFFIPHFGELYCSDHKELDVFESLIKKNGIRYIVEEIAERHFLLGPPGSTDDQ